MISQVRSKSWLDAALRDDTFESEKVTMKDKSVFLQKVMKYVSPLAEDDVERSDTDGMSSLRGGKGTNQVVRDFWLACRGTNFSYTS